MGKIYSSNSFLSYLRLVMLCALIFGNELFTVLHFNGPHNHRQIKLLAEAYLVMETRVRVGNKRMLKCDPGSHGNFVRWEREANGVLQQLNGNDTKAGYSIHNLFGPSSPLSEGAVLVLDNARPSQAGQYDCVLDYGRIHYNVSVVENEDQEIMYYHARSGQPFALYCHDPKRKFRFWQRNGQLLTPAALEVEGKQLEQHQHHSAIKFDAIQMTDSGLYQCVFSENQLQNIDVEVVPAEYYTFVDTRPFSSGGRNVAITKAPLGLFVKNQHQHNDNNNNTHYYYGNNNNDKTKMPSGNTRSASSSALPGQIRRPNTIQEHTDFFAVDAPLAHITNAVGSNDDKNVGFFPASAQEDSSYYFQNPTPIHTRFEPNLRDGTKNPSVNRVDNHAATSQWHSNSAENLVTAHKLTSSSEHQRHRQNAQKNFDYSKSRSSTSHSAYGNKKQQEPTGSSTFAAQRPAFNSDRRSFITPTGFYDPYNGNNNGGNDVGPHLIDDYTLPSALGKTPAHGSFIAIALTDKNNKQTASPPTSLAKSSATTVVRRDTVVRILLSIPLICLLCYTLKFERLQN